MLDKRRTAEAIRMRAGKQLCCAQQIVRNIHPFSRQFTRYCRSRRTIRGRHEYRFGYGFHRRWEFQIVIGVLAAILLLQTRHRRVVALRDVHVHVHFDLLMLLLLLVYFFAFLNLGLRFERFARPIVLDAAR